MNPNASTWKPSVGAASWTPGGGFTAPAPAPAAPAQSASSVSEVDESDPLWQVVLKISEGDRDRALKMINDPDQLSAYPEVTALMEAGDSWEAADMAEQVQTKMTISEDAPAPTPEPMETDEPAKAEEKVEEVQDAEPPVETKEGDPREHLNLVFIGHVDAGKSTLSGNILYLTDNVDKRTIERYEREAKERNRESWFLAFIMDTNEEERAKGKTVEVGKAHFESEVKRYTILDAPGHKNYVPNMIQGASQADIGILVISARKGEFEAGFDRGGQSREHAMLAKTLGVSYLVVVVNKMDEPTVQWKKERFDDIVTKIRPFLRKCGFTIKREVKFIPISGLSGANVKEEVSESECAWWKKMHTAGENNTDKGTLLSLLDSLVIPNREASGHLRIPVLDRYSDRGTVAMGKVESGTIRPGMKVTVMPTRAVYKVDEVCANETPVSGARPGENVLVKLNGAKVEDIRRGFVICSKTDTCRSVDKVICKIAIADMPENTKVMTAGFQCMFHAHTAEEECTVTKIFETTNTRGQVVKGARFASVNMQAVVMLELGQTVPLETFDDMPFLGRFTLRTEGKTVAIGKVQKLPPRKDD
mmetsp:Transcript_16942/g.36981  ORF Transcript_16942/g.36981 Transcript_16942/m.36981 type:complete len:590 (+) Transcript_16942:140-1909(+)|eukprot:CAMPEP_0168733284 /NCGR_PEP_ID=MMETSP0724-20121128/8213_1 /TAXON_ID=265536 /ORGANISM="Amphiprora sp., Strain CCMP467" /LENGTH=589 /DNA_ID=CAMNT_0008780341 /DNA_START=134 /DNA_END=1903 /DNA_ORIENTATION=+